MQELTGGFTRIMTYLHQVFQFASSHFGLRTTCYVVVINKVWQLHTPCVLVVRVRVCVVFNSLFVCYIEV